MMSSGGNLVTASACGTVIRNSTALAICACDRMRQVRRGLGLVASSAGCAASTFRLEAEWSSGRGSFFRNLTVSQASRRLRGVEIHAARVRIKKKSRNVQLEGEEGAAAMMSSGGNLLTVSACRVGMRNLTAVGTRARYSARKIRRGSGLGATTSGCVSSLSLQKQQQSIGRGSLFRNLPALQTPRRPRRFELQARVKKKSGKNFEVRLESGEIEDDLAQLAVALPLGLVSFEGLFLVGWLASLRGLLPGSSRGFFAAADLILCAIMFANCVVGWYALEHSLSGIQALPVGKRTRQSKAAGVGLLNMASSLALSFIPFANLFLWSRFASKQRHLSAKAKVAVIANALIYEGPKFFALLLLFSGGLRVFLQVALVSNAASLFGALHRPFEEARIKNEKVLMEVSRAKKIGSKKGQVQKPKAKEISAEEREKIDRLRELEEFDMLLAQSASRADAVTSGQTKPKEWSVGETMEWLGQQGFARYATTFAENNIDGELLLQLTNNDLRNELKIRSLGDRKKLELLIRQLLERDHHDAQNYSLGGGDKELYPSTSVRHNPSEDAGTGNG